ncbi:MAG: Lhr family helicase, partial [Candidatus Binataceae bacterium]
NARHSFPLADTLTMISAKNAGDVLTQAILDAPMFEVRFRHVASRALSIMRSDKGKRIPAWIQRLRAQELMAALFPGRVACFENRPPRVDVPGHFIVGETMRECLEESADVRRLAELLGGIERGDIRVVTVDSIAPSVFAHRILLAWDYSFLDDGERANRRSRTVTMNRAMSEDVLRTEDLSEMLARDAIAAVEMEVSGRASSRRARNRDELLEIVRAHGVIERDGVAERSSGDSAAIIGELFRENRIVAGRLTPASALSVIASEDFALFAAAYPEFLVENDRGPRAPIQSEIAPEAAREEIVRRALATSGPVTFAGLSRRLGFSTAEIRAALIALESKGNVFRGHFMRADGDGESEQWCDRYNLERIHRDTLGRLRAEIEPCAHHEFAAFRLRWSHIGGFGTAPGPDAIREALERLGGIAFTAEFWEHSLLPARIPGYRAEYLDRICMSGEFRWAAIPDDELVGELPARIAFFRRRDRLAPRPDPATIVEAKERAVWLAASEGGAQFLDEIADRANLSEPDTLRALWRLAAAGFVSNDSFAPLRLLWSEPAARLGETSRDTGNERRNAAVRARLKSSAAGRWSAIRRPDAAAETDYAREIAMMLLARNGIVAREMLQLETVKLGWSDVAYALRRLEYAGAIRRGYFAGSLSGEQYALPEALDMLAEVRRSTAAREPPLAMSAADPANPYGAILPSCGVAREASNIIVIRAGRAIAGLAGRALRVIEPADDDGFCATLSAIISFRSRLTIETIDDSPALGSRWIDLMAAMRFHSDGRGLVYDGLPGPRPAKAAAR